MNTGIHLKLALNYMDIFFSGKNLDRLRLLLADEFFFVGPLYRYNSADDYIKALQSDPPREFEYKLIGSFGGDDSICLIFHFKKPGVSTPMAKVFEIKDKEISDILLIFDTGAFH